MKKVVIFTSIISSIVASQAEASVFHLSAEISKPRPPILIQPEVTENVIIAPANTQQKSIANLSPKTKSIIDNVGSGIGSDNALPQRIVIKAGRFEKNPDGSETLAADGNFQDVVESSSAEEFDINVSDNKKPAFNDYETLKKANRALDVGQYEAAIVLYQSVLNESPKDRDAMFGLATSYQKAGRKNRAKEIYKQILTEHPTYEPALSNLLALASSEAPEHALAEFAVIEARNPNFAGVYAQKAKVYREQMNLDYAISNLRKALSIKPNNNNYRYDLAIIEDERGNFSNAIQLYSELVKAANDGQNIPADKELIVERMGYIATLR